MIKKVLIANRGEIALRIMRACKAMGLQTVAVYSKCDSNLLHVRLCDQSICIGPSNPTESYLNIPAILSAAEITQADAIHPGYGFLAENPDFAHQATKSGFKFIGPSAKIIQQMGNKINAIQTMRQFKIPTIPGSITAIKPTSEAKKIARKTGYPVLIKAANGGGGRGMHVVHQEEDLLATITKTQQEAKNIFLNEEIYLEKFLTKPRHIEVQIIADQFGNVVCLGDRDCSVQRRQQKIIEEAPAMNINNIERQKIYDLCKEACQKLGYQGVGTIEFLYEDERFYFIEMNTRIQVEHPVTEMITGIDIIQEQLRIANGQALSIKQDDIKIQGHAIECRINAEDPNTMQPSPGIIEVFHPPGGFGIRIDTHLYSGYNVPHQYDSLIAKIITHGKNRHQACQAMLQALNETVIDGIKTNLPLQKKILANKAFTNGTVNIHFLERLLANKIPCEA